MKYVDEFRRREDAERLSRAIHALVTRPAVIMEVCGGQTHTIVKNGLEDLLPAPVTLVHGPGCPVCVTPAELIDAAVMLAMRPGTILCSFGDMLRVPGSRSSLLDAKAAGSTVRVVYSPLDAVALARSRPDVEVVFFAVGFETTAPANAMAVWRASEEHVENFSVLVAHVLVPPAMRAILDSPSCRVQAFLAPGHVCTVVGYEDYFQFCDRYHVPIVVTGFEPLDLLEGIYLAVRQLERGEARLENQYARAVRRSGNDEAQRIVAEVFEVSDRQWRGIGTIASSGLVLRGPYRRFDALARLGITPASVPEPSECISGLVLQGLRKPHECPAFATRCTPESPLGAPMVSSEGACAAYFAFARHKHERHSV
jgi:hydrogenase expression/formation protein HypD